MAFTHKSVSENFHNERLEFLGDQVLSSIVAKYTYDKYPEKSEGDLTKLTSKIVSRKQLNILGEKLALTQYIKFVPHQNGHKNLLGNTLEAIVGAIFIDKGYKVTEKVIQKTLLEKYLSIDELDQIDEDYKSQVIRWGQQNQKRIEFSTDKINEDEFKSIILVDGVKGAEGNLMKTKKKAEQSVAQLYLESNHFE